MFLIEPKIVATQLKSSIVTTKSIEFKHRKTHLRLIFLFGEENRFFSQYSKSKYLYKN